MVASVNGRRPMSIPRRIGETGRLPWRALSRAGRVSAAGVAASAVLAIALGLFIPRVAEHHTIQARLDAMTTLVRVLGQQTLIPIDGDPLTGPTYHRFDDLVRGGLLGGENLRVKLWNREGQIVYADDRSLVGRRFPPSPPLQAAFAGEPSAEVSDLSDPENLRERGLADELLEFYVPLREGGQVVGVFEVYQDLRPLSAHMAAIRAAVWLAVGSGLSVLLAFLGFLFAATARTMARERRRALERAEDLSTLLRTAEILASDVSIATTIPEALAAFRARLDLAGAAVVWDPAYPASGSTIEDGHEPCASCLAAARESLPSHPSLGGAEPGSRDAERDGCDAAAAPIRSSAELLGTLVACRDAAHPLGERERILLGGLGAQMAAALESHRLFEELRQVTDEKDHLLRRLVDAQEHERRNLVGDLHDGLGQTLTRILYGLRGVRTRLPTGSEEVREELERLETLTDGLSTSLRRYMATIRPAVLEDFGLGRALEAFAREQSAEAGIRIDVRLDQVPDLPAAAAVTLFRAAQEAVMNARKHAEAGRVEVTLCARDGTVVLEVADDGRGVPVLREGVGLASMRDRVASLGGRVDIESVHGRGTTLRVIVPMERSDEARA